ncbi:reverse transcriptase [Cooperia oncophora]
MKTYSSKKDRSVYQHIIRVEKQLTLLEESEARAGRLALFQKNWACISKDPWVREAVQGYKLEFGDQIPQCSLQSACTTDSESDLLSVEVQEMLDKNAIEEIPWSSEVWTSKIFVIPKKDGGNRTIINLKPLNRYIKTYHFKLESIGMIKVLLEKHDYMAKIDLKDAYFSVPIHREFRKYLAFQYGGRLFQFKALPSSGLSSAPYVFTRLMRAIASELRSRGIRLIVYLDDWLIIDEDKESLSSKISQITMLLKNLGLTINEKKSQLEPSQVVEFLGMTINSLSFELSVPDQKIATICQAAKKMRKRRKVTLREVASFIGQVNSVSMAASIAVLFLRPLQMWLGSFPLKNASDYKTLGTLPESCARDLAWLSQNFGKVAREPILHEDESLTVTSDASNMGWGAIWHTAST